MVEAGARRSRRHRAGSPDQMRKVTVMKSMMRMIAVTFLSLVAGCGVTDPKPLIDEFTWEAVENPNDVVEGVDIAGFFRDISFLGQVKTPTLCYSVKSSLQTSGNT